jgi:hypothetical protein
MERKFQSRIISAQEFNTIPYLHDQFRFPSDPIIVAALGDVFYKHNVHDRFALHLLHRHYLLPEDCIVVKSDVDSEISLTKIEPISSVNIHALRGILYRLDDAGNFQAYEYERGGQIDIPANFLEELSAVLRKFKLEQVLALDVGGRLSPSITSFEYDYGSSATVTVHLNRKPISLAERLTGMAFSFEDEKAHIYHPDVYEKNVKGNHTVFYNHEGSIVDEDNFKIDVSAIRGVLISNEILAC